MLLANKLFFEKWTCKLIKNYGRDVELCILVLIWFFFAINYFSVISLSLGGANEGDACGEVYERFG